MGFNNYNAGLSASAETALGAADALVSLGLQALGYVYVNIDDGWPTMERDGSGNMVPDPTKWPDGIEPVAAQLHEMGLKFGRCFVFVSVIPRVLLTVQCLRFQIGLYGDSGTAVRG
jgi:hypothetical protein